MRTKLFSTVKEFPRLFRISIISTLLMLFPISLFSQGILTASSFFKQVSENYSTIKDYEADLSIKAGKNSMSGHISYKYPDLLRIDFTNPEEQVICFNGDLLTIYLPGSAAILNQTVDNSFSSLSSSSGTGS